MKVKMNDSTIKECLGEVIYIGFKSSAKYEDGEKVADIGAVQYDLGAPLYANNNQEGASIQVRVETDRKPNIKPFKPVKFTNLVYDPYAGVSQMGDNARGILNDRFTCDAIEALHPQDRLYDEETGEKIEDKSIVSKK